MEQRAFGNTGIKVSVLGFGAGHIGSENFPEKEVESLLNIVLDSGITLIDTARAYGLSEERIGKYLRRRRNEFILSTKVGYGIEGYENWTYECVRAGIDQALRLLQTDYIDIVHLHSCPLGTLQWGEPLRALEDGVRAHKVRVAAYSGENEALEWSVESGRFGSVEHSINICDQRAIDNVLGAAKAKGWGSLQNARLQMHPGDLQNAPLAIMPKNIGGDGRPWMSTRPVLNGRKLPFGLQRLLPAYTHALSARRILST
jgi:aryl-alcohol dehydrogenase-like predicted oxidoreductase